jgi:hypothetical protein
VPLGGGLEVGSGCCSKHFQAAELLAFGGAWKSWKSGCHFQAIFDPLQATDYGAWKLEVLEPPKGGAPLFQAVHLLGGSSRHEAGRAVTTFIFFKSKTRSGERFTLNDSSRHSLNERGSNELSSTD